MQHNCKRTFIFTAFSYFKISDAFQPHFRELQNEFVMYLQDKFGLSPFFQHVAYVYHGDFVDFVPTDDAPRAPLALP